MKTNKTKRRHATGASKLLGLVAAAATLAGSARAPEAAEHMLVLIDQSGSMSSASTAGGTRWDVAKQLAADAVNAVAPDRSYAVWTFNNNTYSQVVSFADGLTQAQVSAVIEFGLGTPANATPLAGSICDAVDELINYLPSEFHLKRLELFSDGLENNTPNVHECYGPNSADHSIPDVGSWEWKVFNKVRTGNPNSAALPPIPLIVNADFLFDHEGSIFSSTFAAPRSGLPLERIVVSQKPSISVIQQVKSPLVRSLQLEGAAISQQIIAAPHLELAKTIGFYQNLANNTGGRYRSFTPSTRLPQLGDLTGDYCVNGDDYNAVVNNWGTTVAPGSPLDPNQDHKVDVYDYMTVLQNYGEGC